MSGPRDADFDAWVQRAKDGAFERAVALCGFVPARGLNRGRDHAGPCPACGGRDRFSVNYSKRKYNCRGCGARGADALNLALVGDHLSFIDACEALSGEPRPASVAAETEAQRAERAARRAAHDKAAAEDAARRAAEAEEWRRRAIQSARKIWARGRAPSRIVPAYLAARGCDLPASAMLREIDDLAFVHGETPDETGRSMARVIHRGPAMLAAIVDNAGEFIGLHRTFLAADWSGKAVVVDPDTGELPKAKKSLGSTHGGHIVLRDGGPAPRRLFIGEGIETVLSVATALRRLGQLRRDDAFWTSIDLGNLGGPHAGTIRHPSLKTPKGRPQTLPGPEPLFDAPAMALPDSLDALVLLGDGDSERFLTETTLERAARRYARPGLFIARAMAPEGRDFNDVLRATA